MKKYAVRKMVGKSHANNNFLKKHKNQDSINDRIQAAAVGSDQLLNSNPSNIP